jgi:hypothetical protein
MVAAVVTGCGADKTALAARLAEGIPAEELVAALMRFTPTDL